LNFYTFPKLIKSYAEAVGLTAFSRIGVLGFGFESFRKKN
jgi:hypothetical protein